MPVCLPDPCSVAERSEAILDFSEPRVDSLAVDPATSHHDTPRSIEGGQIVQRVGREQDEVGHSADRHRAAVASISIRAATARVPESSTS